MVHGQKNIKFFLYTEPGVPAVSRFTFLERENRYLKYKKRGEISV
jgi:hypothetical protein